uniref:t-SNARE coiled-coil homology domain-containing protein n=1 Tax=Chrysotila carterae TaxID=13221 RepID=A0A6S9QPD3_CHRCT|mmetsp:Transcript_15528/g.33079  ORF Transcript_15528/g.33079 Transcript_15528/m.33079 type:complete len:146 (+) Transcript_15528:334-771(+)
MMSHESSQASMQRTASSNDCIREDLFSPAGGSQGSDAGERARMLTTSDRLIKGNERLKNAHSVTLEMEGMAASILNDLSKQRETLMRSKSTLSYATQQLDVSRRVVQAMARRAATNKAVLYLIIALIGGVLLLTAWSQTNVAARR